MLKIYEYSKCGTCRKAQKYLDQKGVAYTLIPIRETPPSLKELKAMLEYLNGDLKRLFNTSGQDYRALKIKDKINDLSEAEGLKLLASNGNLIKRPFVLTDSSGTVGFKEEIWDELF